MKWYFYKIHAVAFRLFDARLNKQKIPKPEKRILESWSELFYRISVKSEEYQRLLQSTNSAINLLI